MATPQEISTYLSNILYAQSVYMDEVCKRELLGYKDIFQYRLRAAILNYYVKIMIDYFSQYPYDTYNFFTTEEVQDIIDRINRLCDSNYNLNL